MEKRVVITGIGAITPIGNTKDELWKAIEEKKCGIDKITYFDKFCRIAKTGLLKNIYLVYR